MQIPLRPALFLASRARKKGRFRAINSMMCHGALSCFSWVAPSLNPSIVQPAAVKMCSIWRPICSLERALSTSVQASVGSQGASETLILAATKKKRRTKKAVTAMEPDVESPEAKLKVDTPQKGRKKKEVKPAMQEREIVPCTMVEDQRSMQPLNVQPKVNRKRKEKSAEHQTFKEEIQISEVEGGSTLRTSYSVVSTSESSSFVKDDSELKPSSNNHMVIDKVITTPEQQAATNMNMQVTKQGEHTMAQVRRIEPGSNPNAGGTDETLQIEVKTLVQEKPAPLSKRQKKSLPQSELRFTLDNCSKFGDVHGALAAYDKTKAEGVLRFDQYNYNVVLYLCSSAALGVLSPGRKSRQGSGNHGDTSGNDGPRVETVEELAVEDDGILFRGNMAALIGRNVMCLPPEMMKLAQERGLEIYQQMQADGVPANEPTFTALARLAVAKRDGDLAFDIVKQMTAANITARLRSYGPALYTYFKNNDVHKAFDVDKHMLAHGVQPEEVELEVLFDLSSRAGLEDKVYSVLHRIRRTVRGVSPSTVNTIERWFRSDVAGSVLGRQLRIEDVRSALDSTGGGWHGLGWLGEGKWNVEYSHLDKTGVCENCKEKMVIIDIDPKETERFAELVASLTHRKEKNIAAFKNFQAWLDCHGPFDAVLDGANVGMNSQSFGSFTFSFAKLNGVVDALRQKRQKFLVLLHQRRTRDAAASTPFAQQVLKKLQMEHALYTTPTDSNDDWYWLYAAVKCKCLLITNDEMRDHIFQLLGNDFFPRWKERHQVRFEIPHQRPVFHMPPPYSVVIQESERGSWHVPKSGGDDITTPRVWLCATRPGSL